MLAAALSALSISLFFSQSAEASYIGTHRVNIDLKNSGDAHVTAEVFYEDMTTIDAVYIIFAPSDNFSARDKNGLMKCTPTPQAYGVSLSCRPNTNETDKMNYSVTFDFDIKNAAVKTADAHTFSYVYSITEPTKSLEVLLALPEGTGIVKSDVFRPYSPDAIVGSTGRQVTLDWLFNQTELGKAYTFTAIYENVGSFDTPSQRPSPPSQASIYAKYSTIAALFFAAAFAVLLWRFLIYRSKNIGDILSILRDDERKVVEIIASAKGKCKQKLIVQSTNFSKAKVSRILSGLSERGIVDIIPSGRTNNVVLSKDKKPKQEPKGPIIPASESNPEAVHRPKSGDESESDGSDK